MLTAKHVAICIGGTYCNGYGCSTVQALCNATSVDAFAANDLSLLQLTSSASAAPYLPVASDWFADGSFGPLAITISSPIGAPRAFRFTTASAFRTLVDPDDSGPLGAVTANYLLSLDSSVYL